jgi:hypothetical protein
VPHIRPTSIVSHVSYLIVAFYDVAVACNESLVYGATLTGLNYPVGTVVCIHAKNMKDP